MYYFTSDTHFDHKNIMKYCKRPFDTVQEMNARILDGINSRVQPSDILYHLGDFSWSDPAPFINKIKCRNLFVIPGNHDEGNKHVLRSLKQLEAKQRLTICRDIVSLKINKTKLVLCHYPMRSWNGSFHGSIHLYGHVHSGFDGREIATSMDVGVDSHDFNPVSFDEVVEIINKRGSRESTI